MRNKLSIFDVSPFIYSGMGMQDYKNAEVFNFPIGGILNLMKHISYRLYAYTDIVLCFDSKSFRKDLSKSYKSHRQKSPQVYAQLDLLYEILPKCGIVCLKKEGYEADDLIYNVVQENQSKYFEIEILGTDYDLTHNVAFPNVTFQGITRLVNSITPNNFSNGIVMGKTLYYNTISAYKVLCGDSSDTINAFKSTQGNLTGGFLYNKYAQLLEKNRVLPFVARERKLLEQFIRGLEKYLTNEDYTELYRNMDLVFPVKLDDDFSEYTNLKGFDLKPLQRFLSTIDDTVSLKSINKGFIGRDEEIVKRLKITAKELLSGEYSVDHNRPFRDVGINTEVTNLKEF